MKKSESIADLSPFNLAVLYLAAKRDEADAILRADAVKKDLLRALEENSPIEIPGVGSVTLVSPSTRKTLDTKAATKLLELRGLAVPYSFTPVAASVRALLNK